MGDRDYAPPSERGVLYFSSVPPDMRPHEIRAHFSRFGALLRQRFVPFRPRERRPGGPPRPLQFRCGHLEFARAKAAERAAAAMNATAVECRRRRRCHGALWTVRFLRGFAWDALLEEREEGARRRRARETEARGAERAANEAFRAAVMARRGEWRGKREREREREEGEEEEEEVGEEEKDVQVVVEEGRAAKRIRKETQATKGKATPAREKNKVKKAAARREKTK